MKDRVEYALNLFINQRFLRRVIIDQHYKIKHSEITDDQILNLVKEINGGNFEIEVTSNGFQYFTIEPVFYNNLPFRLILLMHEDEDFLGVVNVFRVQRKKYE